MGNGQLNDPLNVFTNEMFSIKSKCGYGNWLRKLIVNLKKNLDILHSIVLVIRVVGWFDQRSWSS